MKGLNESVIRGWPTDRVLLRDTEEHPRLSVSNVRIMDSLDASTTEKYVMAEVIIESTDVHPKVKS